MKTRIFLTILIATTFVTNSDLIAQNTEINETKSIKQHISQYMNWYDIPGLSIGLIKNGEIYYTKGFGIKCIDSKEKVTKNTIFSTASVTKLFVGMAIMQLNEENKVDLNKSVSSYLPYFELIDTLFKKITIKQLLNHTSGLPDEEGDEFYSSWENPEYDDDALKRYVKGLKSKTLVSIPGENYNYSNIGYEILGCVVSEVSGISLEDYINNNIIKPIGMQHSNMLLNNIDTNLLACPHILDKDLKFKINEYFPYTRRHSASGTLLSNIDDMCRFAITILNKGIIDKNRILKESSLKKMLTLENDNPAGLSWHITEVDSTMTLIFHAGGDPGFRTELILIPEKQLGVVIMANMWEHQIEPLAYKMLNILLEDDEKDWFTFFHGSTWEIIRTNNASSALDKIKSFISDNNDQKFHPAILNQHSNSLLEIGRINYAIELRKFNVELYPKISKLYDLLAEVYLQNEQTDWAIKNYEKSLELNPENTNAKEMLEKLK